MKKLLTSVILAIVLAIIAVNAGTATYRSPVPVVYRIESLPCYGRRKPLKRHFIPLY